MSPFLIIASALAVLLFVEVNAQSTCPDFLPFRFGDPEPTGNDAYIRLRETISAGPRRFVGAADPSRIVGGTATDLSSDLPRYIVRVNSNGGSCTGSVVNKRFVLTAAHCEGSASSTNAQFLNTATGNWDTFVDAVNVIPHPDYNPSTLENDIMLIELGEDVPDSALFVTINSKRRIPRGGAVTRTAGFGVTSSGGGGFGTLRQVDVPVRGRRSCESFLSGNYVHSNMVCAGYKCGGCDACQGDSGGPLFQPTTDGKLFQVGITSWGYGCANARRPGVYARVSLYKDWIKSTVGSNGHYRGGDVEQIRLKGNACPVVA